MWNFVRDVQYWQQISKWTQWQNVYHRPSILEQFEPPLSGPDLDRQSMWSETKNDLFRDLSFSFGKQRNEFERFWLLKLAYNLAPTRCRILPNREMHSLPENLKKYTSSNDIINFRGAFGKKFFKNLAYFSFCEFFSVSRLFYIICPAVDLEWRESSHNTTLKWWRKGVNNSHFLQWNFDDKSWFAVFFSRIKQVKFF